MTCHRCIFMEWNRHKRSFTCPSWVYKHSAVPRCIFEKWLPEPLLSSQSMSYYFLQKLIQFARFIQSDTHLVCELLMHLSKIRQSAALRTLINISWLPVISSRNTEKLLGLVQSRYLSLSSAAHKSIAYNSRSWKT